MTTARRLLFTVSSFTVFTALFVLSARGSDPPETAAIAQLPGTDLCDLYVFPSPTHAANVVLIMTVHPLIPPGAAGSVVFDPNVLYQFKIDNTGDAVEDLVIQAQFTGTGTDQKVQISGPSKPAMTGAVSVFGTPDSVSGVINKPFTLSNGAMVYAGAAEDPMFFDVNQFFTIFPDRAGPINGSTFTNTSGTVVSTSPADPNAPQAAAWRGQATALDFMKNLNVLAIAVELPKTMLAPNGSGKINVWCTTSR